MRIFLLLLITTIYLIAPAQTVQYDSTICRVTQFFDEDSTNAKTELTIVYNNRWQVIAETYGRFEENCLSYMIGYSVRYTYSDSLLESKIVNEKQKAPYRYTYAYNDKGKAITESKFKWIPDQSAPPVHRPGIPDSASAANGKWEQVSLAKISYDDKGRKILWDASRLHDANENMEKWEYDDKNRVTSHMVYAHGRLARKTDYTYTETGYRYWEIRYDEEGDLMHEKESGQGYSSMIMHTITLDKSGRIVSEVLSDEKNRILCTVNLFYDKSGRLVRTVRYDELITTHVYTYEKQPK